MFYLIGGSPVAQRSDEDSQSSAYFRASFSLAPTAMKLPSGDGTSELSTSKKRVSRRKEMTRVKEKENELGFG